MTLIDTETLKRRKDLINPAKTFGGAGEIVEESLPKVELPQREPQQSQALPMSYGNPLSRMGIDVSGLEALKRAKESGGVSYDSSAEQKTILGASGRVSQAFGVRNPGVEVFRKDGVNVGTDIAVPSGTAIAAPPTGDWKVVEAYGEARGRGYIGNNTNNGYGNSVVLMNPRTGETIRFSHLSVTSLRPGQTVRGGQLIGLSGATGNVTGAHVDIEYKDARGNYQDIMKSPYGQYLM